LDVWACHGMAGTWGCIATGLFADKTINPGGADGLFRGNPHLLLVQIIAIVSVWAFTFVVTYMIAKLVDAVLHFTVPTEEQEMGLDVFHLGLEITPDLLSAAVLEGRQPVAESA